MTITNDEHWTGLASRWNWIGSPLKPIKQDTDIMARMLGNVLEHALLLGVTSELAHLAKKITAVDKNEDMIKACWSGQDSPAIHGDWLNLSTFFEVGTFDVVLGDGSLNCIRFPDEISKLFIELDKVTNAGARLVFRAFLSPAETETVEDVIAAARNGKIGNFHAFRWRMAQAVAAETAVPNVMMRDVYLNFQKFVTDRAEFSKQSGFDMASIEKMDVYKTSEVFFSFPTLQQLLSSIPSNWELLNIEHGDYELGERCPVLMLRRKLTDIIWPSVDGQKFNNIDRTLNVLLETQKLSCERLEFLQLRQFKVLSAYYYKHSAYFRSLMQGAGLNGNCIENIEQFKQIPLLSRKRLQADFAMMDCSRHAGEAAQEVVTSGATGTPVSLKRSERGQAFWFAYSMREHLWHKRDFKGTLAILRGRYDDKREVFADWGQPVNLFTRTGKAYVASIRNMKISEQVEWLNSINPDYLLTLPTCLSALLDETMKGHLHLDNIKQVRTISESLTHETRQRVKNIWGVDTVDMYSSQEAGVIANQCPHCGNYHVNESYILEILDKDGNECKAGEKGRVVITDLHNYATPLIRYDIGDYAEYAADNEICSAGIGLKTIKRIYGRERNLLKLNGGELVWPFVGYHLINEIVPIIQYQLVQKSMTDIEARFVCETKPSSAQEKKIAEIMSKSLGQSFNFTFVYFDVEIPRGPSGKFEEFICEC